MVRYFHRPTNLTEATARLAEAGYDGKVVAGGTALVLMLQQGLIAPSHLISLDAVTDEGFRGIDVVGGSVRIGGGETITRVGGSEIVRNRLPSLAYACQRVGNVRIRNRATLAGNLAEADYASDPPSVLVSLGALCRAVSPRGERIITVADLITGFYSTSLEPDEIIVDIIVPLPALDARMAYIKYVSRSAEDRPCAGVAAVVRTERGEIADATVAVGAVADTPQHFPDIIEEARGKPADRTTFAGVAGQYAERISPLTDGRGSAEYRRQMIRVFVRRAFEQALAQVNR